MARNDKRIDELAKAAGSDGGGWDDADNVLAVAIAEARADGALFAPAPSTVTQDALQHEQKRLEAIKRLSAEQQLELRLARARLRAGCYVGSPLERWRAELLVAAPRDALITLQPQPEVDAAGPAIEAPAQPEAAQRPDELNEANVAEAIKWTPLNPDPQARWRR